MSVFHCSCGFAIDDPDEYDDHIHLSFARDNDIGTDGQVHTDTGGGSVGRHECACGFTTIDAPEFDDHLLIMFVTPDGVGADGRELTTHFLDVYPPHTCRPSDGGQHADASRLGVKLDSGSPAASEVVTWASDQRSDLRVAASIAHRVKSGDLSCFDTVLRQDITEACQVSLHVVGNAIGILKDHGVLRNLGGRNSVICDDIDKAIGGRIGAGHVLHTIVRHIAKLENEVSALRIILERPRLAHETGRLETARRVRERPVCTN